MPENQLRETVAKLREELDADQGLSEERAARLRAIVADIEGLLEKREASENDSLPVRLAEAASDFETSHPRLTSVLGQIADALSRMGI
ncbi:MAG TPA: DUF4404 family protein [Planctomycetes bacterium]|nr:DUF4404 family protein [Planctomycetota bacterium]